MRATSARARDLRRFLGKIVPLRRMGKGPCPCPSGTLPMGTPALPILQELGRFAWFSNAMKFWLVCFLILFAAAEGLQWLGQFAWLGSMDLSHPLVIGAGIGLAIASNYSPQGRLTKSLPLQSTAKPCDSANPSPAQTMPAPTTARPPSPSKSSSISFEIRKPAPEANQQP